MTYDYEQLLDEQFQQVCQSLVVREYPGAQCYPVGMPDGGRDATADGGAIVLQVKYARDFRKIADPVKWFKKAIDGERAKIEKLISRGASSYILITNMPGTSHLDIGTMDLIQAHMNETIQVPSFCWWRDDLDRRLDNNFDLKMRFPAILSGPDLLRQLLQSFPNEHRERRLAAMSSYLINQESVDSTVRFKQADLLSSALFDLFIDVPASVARGDVTQRPSIATFQSYVRTVERIVTSDLPDTEPRANRRRLFASGPTFGPIYMAGLEGNLVIAEVGAAELMLDVEFSEDQPQILLEGAPGQGKSTLAQYLAQVHRSRLLSRPAVEDLPERIQKSPIRYPVKIELRDLATWLTGLDPWSGTAHVPHNKPRTLEAALAAHIARYSGGTTFEVDDLLIMCQDTPVLVLLDALDEVADIADRRLVVTEVEEGIRRLRGVSETVRVIVTSRPTAVANSPSFSPTDFVTLSLSSIGRELAVDYTHRWSAVHKIGEVDESELIDLLRDKLDQPHMNELAQNTMQLSILLSLLHLRGPSLPDKRTELYDAYVDVFLNRESEKSRIVRDNRELLVDIHRYLAFYLHAHAETKRGSGRIATDDLKALLTEYLTADDRDLTLVGDLMTGVLERVVALVSRVEGTYEFEVQPLREYFAARHLYDTASYSPPGNERRGTKPDRFDALAPNAYWLNTSRFFAGCFSKGELLDLAERVCDVINSSVANSPRYTRHLAQSLIEDMVFTQSPKATLRVVDASYDAIGMRLAAHEVHAHVTGRITNAIRVGLPGDERISNLLQQHLAVDGDTDRAFTFCMLLRRTAPKIQIDNWWRAEAQHVETHRMVDWTRIGCWLGACDGDDIRDFLGRRVLDEQQRLQILDLAGRSDAIRDDADDSLVLDGVRAVLSKCAGAHRGSATKSTALTLLTLAVDVRVWVEWLRPTNAWGPDYLNGLLSNSPEHLNPTTSAVLSVLEVVHTLDLERLQSELSQWCTVVDLLESIAGPSATSIELSVMAAGIRSSSERGGSKTDFLNSGIAMPVRMRSARRKAGNSGWWTDAAERASTNSERFSWLLALLTWATPQTISAAMTYINELASALTNAEIDEASSFLHGIAPNVSRSASATLEIKTSSLGPKALSLLLSRLSGPSKQSALDVLQAEPLTQGLATQLMRTVTEGLLTGADQAESTILRLTKFHDAGGKLDVTTSQLVGELGSLSDANLSLIISNCWTLPSALISAAEQEFSSRLPQQATVLSIADRDGWFSV